MYAVEERGAPLPPERREAMSTFSAHDGGGITVLPLLPVKEMQVTFTESELKHMPTPAQQQLSNIFADFFYAYLTKS